MIIKNILKYTFILSVLLLMLTSETKGQDPQFSQFYAAPLYLSPSFAGTSSQKTRVAFNYRNQWPEIPNAFSTYAFSFDHYVSKIKSGIGAFFMRDQAGPGHLGTTQVGGLYSFNIQVNHNFHIRPGAHFMYAYRNINFNDLTFYHQMENSSITPDLYFNPDHEQVGDVDFSLSAIAYSDLYWLGVTADHLLSPQYSFFGDQSITPIKYSIFGGARVLVDERLLIRNQEDVSFAFLYKKQGAFQQFDLGAYYFKNPLILGIWYRGIPIFKNNFPGSDAAVFLVGYRIENVSIGYSYDFTISKMRNLTGGAHELSLIWSFKVKKFRQKPASLPCPEF